MYKGLPFKTEWVEFPDVAARMKEVGSVPTEKDSDGNPKYTLPVILDSSTGKVITNSIRIAEYLDDTYPNSPSLFPPIGGQSTHSRAAIHILDAHFMNTALQPMRLAFIASINAVFNPRSQEYFRSAREKDFGMKLEDIAPTGSVKRKAMFIAGKEGFSKLASMYEENGADLPYFFGKTFSYADCIVTGFLFWMRRLLGEDSAEWKDIATWDGGRWAKLLDLSKDYYKLENI